MEFLKITINGEAKQVEFTDSQAEIMKSLLSGAKTTYTKKGDFVWKDNPDKLVGVRVFHGAMEKIKAVFKLDTISAYKFTKKFIG